MRMNSRTRPANAKQSPGSREATKLSSTCPSFCPLRICTVTEASLTIVPIDMRWRRAMRASGTCAMPSSPITTRRYSGYALRLAPPWITKSSVHCHSSSSIVAKACVSRTSAFNSSGRKPPPSAQVTRCCTSTSGAWVTGTRGSMRRAAAAPRAAAASTSSSTCVGTTVMRDTSPGRWPLRPARCSRRAMPLGLPICSTWSTGAKSTPRSRLDVHTTARSRPSRSAASTQSRTSRCERAVVQRDRACPVRSRLEQRLVPRLGRRAHVGEHQRGPRALDRPRDFLHHRQAEMSRPRKALDPRSAARWRSRSAWCRCRARCGLATAARTVARMPTRHASAGRG